MTTRVGSQFLPAGQSSVRCRWRCSDLSSAHWLSYTATANGILATSIPTYTLFRGHMPASRVWPILVCGLDAPSTFRARIMDEQGDHATDGLGRPRPGRPTLFWFMSTLYHRSKIQGRVLYPTVSADARRRVQYPTYETSSTEEHSYPLRYPVIVVSEREALSPLWLQQTRKIEYESAAASALAVTLLFLALTVLVTYPLVLQMTHALPVRRR